MCWRTMSGDTDWLLNVHDAGQQHFSPVAEMNDKTVAAHGLAWYAEIRMETFL
jgi:hypothetical protein